MGTLEGRLIGNLLIRDEVGLVCNRNHTLAANKWLAWSAVQGNRVLGNLTHQLLAGTPAARFVREPRLFVSNMTSLLSLISKGQWISPLPVLAVPMDLPDVVAIPLRRPKVTRQIGLIRLKGKPLEPAVAAVEAIVTDIVHGAGLKNGAG